MITLKYIDGVWHMTERKGGMFAFHCYVKRVMNNVSLKAMGEMLDRLNKEVEHEKVEV